MGDCHFYDVASMSINMFDQSSILHNFEDSVLDLTLGELRLDDGFVEEPDEDEEELNQDFTLLSGPSIRCFLLRKSLESLQSKNDSYMDSIVYETAALSIWSLYKYQPSALKYHLTSKDKILQTVFSPLKSGNPLIDACRKQMAPQHQINRSSGPREVRKVKDKVDVTKELVTRCRQLPDEWNVIQLCKRYNANQGHQLQYEYHTAHVPLNITLFKYARSELMDHKPLCFCIHAEKFNIYKEAYDINQSINSATRNQQLIKSSVETQIKDQVNLLQQFLGPWVVLFSGRAKNSATTQYEQKIFNLVDKFCTSTKLIRSYKPRQRLLISLVARRTDLLSDGLLCDASLGLAETHEQQVEILEFLRKIVKTVKQGSDHEYFPTTMIIDELVDYVFWEMVCPKQEFARIGSMAMLFKLFDKYKDQIKGGYLRVNVENGFVLCNPDNNLPMSEKRLQPFFETWYPNYQFMSGKPPVSEQMMKSLNAADIYIYAGHGSGLQFIGGRDLYQCNMHCITFLYGCQSVALKSSGLQSECVGAHTYLQNALCPGVVGTLNITTDTLTDIVTIGVCKMWLPTSSEEFLLDGSWSNLSPYYTSAIEFFKIQPLKSSLLEVLQIIRCTQKLPIRMRCTLVYRGIPVARN